MNINIKATKIKLTPEVKGYIQEKMDMVEKYLGGITPINADFEVEMTTHHHNKGEIYRAEVNLLLPGQLLCLTKTEKELLKVIDKVKDHLEIMIKKYKEKRIDKKRKGRAN